jgi:CRP-like cAMP-binding protein
MTTAISRTKSSITNRILSRLTPRDYDLVAPHLRILELPLRKRLEIPGRLIEHVYFPESGFASVVANGTGVERVEVGLIGREGMTGLAVVLGANQTPNETFIQNAGAGLMMPAAELRQFMNDNASIRDLLLIYAHTFLVQATQTAKTNARSKIEERLARWLLMAHDRLDTDDLVITHEFLSMMLGVRRSGVTIALNLLERSALVSTDRGVISILDRGGLKQAANGAYGVSEAEFNRLFG